MQQQRGFGKRCNPPAARNHPSTEHEVRGDRGIKLAPLSRTAGFAPDTAIPWAGEQTAHRISLLWSRPTSILCRLNPIPGFGLDPTGRSSGSSTGSPAADFIPVVPGQSQHQERCQHRSYSPQPISCQGSALARWCEILVTNRGQACPAGKTRQGRKQKR